MANDPTNKDDQPQDNTINTTSKGDTQVYRVERGTISRFEGNSTAATRYKKGAFIEMTEAQARAAGQRVSPVSQGGAYAPSVATNTVSADVDETTTVETGPPKGKGTLEGDPQANDYANKLSTLGWAEAVSMVNDLESEGDVQAVLDAEKKGSRRKSVIEAAENKLEELKADS